MRSWRRIKSSTGASAINCWRPADNSMTCYSLRVHPCKSVLALARVHHEDSLPAQGVPIIGKTPFRKRYPFWVLSDPLGKAPSISMPDLREDVLFQYRDSLLSASASPGHL